MYAGSCLLLIEEKIESYQRRVVLGLVGGGLQSSNLRYELVFSMYIRSMKDLFLDISSVLKVASRVSKFGTDFPTVTEPTVHRFQSVPQDSDDSARSLLESLGLDLRPKESASTHGSPLSQPQFGGRISGSRPHR